MQKLSDIRGAEHGMSGVIADLNPKACCSKVGHYKGERYVHLNKMVSTVMNVYDKSFFPIMAQWEEKDD